MRLYALLSFSHWAITNRLLNILAYRDDCLYPEPVPPKNLSLAFYREQLRTMPRPPFSNFWNLSSALWIDIPATLSCLHWVERLCYELHNSDHA